MPLPPPTRHRYEELTPVEHGRMMALLFDEGFRFEALIKPPPDTPRPRYRWHEVWESGTEMASFTAHACGDRVWFERHPRGDITP